jgi:hypothetical protein
MKAIISVLAFFLVIGVVHVLTIVMAYPTEIWDIITHFIG